MEKRTAEEISLDLQREFAKDMYADCGGESKIVEEEKHCWDNSVWDCLHPDKVCTECHLG